VGAQREIGALLECHHKLFLNKKNIFCKILKKNKFKTQNIFSLFIKPNTFVEKKTLVKKI